MYGLIVSVYRAFTFKGLLVLKVGFGIYRVKICLWTASI